MFLSDFPTLDTSKLDLPAIDTSALLKSLPDITLPSTPAPSGPQSSSFNIPTMAPITVQMPAITPQASPLTPIMPLTTVQMPPVPSTNVAPATPAAATSGDWFSRNIMPILSTGLQTYAAVKQYDTAANIAQANLQAQNAAITRGLPVGVSPNALVTQPTLTAQQLATMTPAQLQAYYASPYTTGISPTGTGILSSLGLGSMSTTEMLMLGGAGLLLFFMLTNKK